MSSTPPKHINPDKSNTNQLMRAALYYARVYHFPVFPCEPRGKRPLTLHGCKDASTHPEQIERWWTEFPDANIGIVTGQTSGVVVVDVDGDEGRESLRALEQKGYFPKTVRCLTAKGEHIYLKGPGFLIKNAVRICPGLDIRADGGYVIAPPSVHESGKKYVWEISHRPDEVLIAEMPEWVKRWLTQKSVVGLPEAKPYQYWQTLTTTGIPEGERNAKICEFSGHLLRRFVDPYVVLELMQVLNEVKCKPPLEPQEVLQIVTSIATKERARRQEF